MLKVGIQAVEDALHRGESVEVAEQIAEEVEERLKEALEDVVTSQVVCLLVPTFKRRSNRRRLSDD
mgnify:CR=1 FL=1